MTIAITRLIVYRKVGSGGEGFLNVPLYAGASLEAGNTWASRRDISLKDLRYASSVFLGSDTGLGPLYVGIGYAPRGQGWRLAAEGQIALDGPVPISTLGGLKGRGHPIGASALYQTCESTPFSSMRNAERKMPM